MPVLHKILLFLLIGFSFYSLVLAYYFWRRRKAAGAISFTQVNLSIFIWCVGYIIELWAPDLSGKMLGVKIQYTFGIPFVSVFFLFAVLSYKTLGRRPTFIEKMILLINPVLTMIFMWTDNAHNLMYVNEHVIETGSFILIEKQWGLWYYINIVYSYFALIGGTIILLLSINRLQRLYKLQTIFLMIGLIISWAANIIYLAGSNSFLRFDVTIFGFAMGNSIIALALFKYQLFDVIPAARDTVFESIDNGIIVVDNYERIVDMNPAAIRIFGMKGLVGNSILNLFNEFKIDPAMIREVEISKTEIKIDNTIFDLIISPVWDNKGAIAGSVLYFHDITGLKKTQKELSESNKAKDKFFSIIAHDLKNPFFGIIGLSGMINEDFESMDDGQKKEMVNDINELAVNTYKLLENLLEWSRQQTGTIEFMPKQFNLSAILEENIRNVKQRAQLKKIDIIPEFQADNFVFADENMINAVVRNLISNALKFTLPEGSVRVAAYNKNNAVVVAIKDNGVGMDADTKKKLFHLEHNIKSVGTSGERGTGLGLLLCKDFVERNKGEIWAESEIGTGSTFFFSLPTKE